MQNFSKWEDEEVKTLFRFVEVKKSEGVPLIKIFSEYANATKRHTNSVRNYYYKEVSNIKNNVNRFKELGIDISAHEVTRGRPFTKSEESSMMNELQNLIENGYSVRKACLKLSNGDVSKMIRLQNKYRSIIKKENSQTSSKTEMGQIIKMPQSKGGLSDEDIKALFMGLLKLVKKQEQENAKSMVSGELFDANLKLEKAMAEIVAKENEINKLQREISVVRSRLMNQKELTVENKIKNMNEKKSASNIVKNFFDGKNYSKVVVNNKEYES